LFTQFAPPYDYLPDHKVAAMMAFCEERERGSEEKREKREKKRREREREKLRYIYLKDE
jgi:hypothetical protein